MPVHYALDDRGFIVIAPVGKNSVHDYMKTFRAIAHDDQYRDVQRILFDTTAIEVSLSSGEIAELASSLTKKEPDRRLAVVTKTALHFGISRMYQAFADEPRMQIFDSMDAAAVWLMDEQT